jgi:hypothetical protein
MNRTTARPSARLSNRQWAVLARLTGAPELDWHSAESVTRRMHRPQSVRHHVERTLDSLVRLGLAQSSAAGLRVVYRATERGRDVGLAARAGGR